MRITSIPDPAGFSRVKLFLALSRTPHTLLDVATPVLCALLWLGNAPPLEVMALGLLTAFSGYTAVYALNDVIDYRVDQEKIQKIGIDDSGLDLDGVYVRHPMAQGVLSYREGIFWMGAWALLTLVGSYILSPVCLLIFLAASLLEILYCLLLKVTYLRGIISGIVKNSGGIAAVFAVTSNPSPLFLVVLFLWLFFWEIGGQNVPNDWADVNEDQKLGAQTIPVRFGPEGSSKMVLFGLLMAVVMSCLMYWVSPAGVGFFYLVGALFSGFYFLLLPALRLIRTRAGGEAFALFNRASYYPLAMLGVVILSLLM